MLIIQVGICSISPIFLKRISNVILSVDIMDKNLVLLEFKAYYDLVDYIKRRFVILDLLIIDDKVMTAPFKDILDELSEKVPILCIDSTLGKVSYISENHLRHLSNTICIGDVINILKKIVLEKNDFKIIAKVGEVSLELSPIDIYYISKLKRGCKPNFHKASDYHMKQGWFIKKHLDQVLLMLSGYGFSKPHDSYIVNMEYVDINLSTRDVLLLSDGTELSVARSKSEEFYRDLADFHNSKQ